MSINTVLTSDKTQFKNFLSDGIAIPANAAVALSKCAIDVPVFAQKMLRVPLISNALRTRNLFNVTIDGIEKNITFREFYTAFTEYPDAAQFPFGVDQDVTEDIFYGGLYEFFINNKLYFSTDGINYISKAPFMWVLAKAISNAYQFYRCTDITEYDEKFCGIPDNQSINAGFAGGAVNYTNCYVRAVEPTEYKLNVAYEIRTQLNRTETESTFSASDYINWGFAANLLTSGAGGVNVAYDNGSDIDLNGGFQRITPTLAAGGITAWGFSLVGNGVGANDKHLPKVYTDFEDATPIIDVGIQFEAVTVGGTDYLVYKIIDGQEQYVHYNGVNHTVENYSIYKPYDAVSRFESGDRFAIVCRRGNIIDSNYEYDFDIKMGNGVDVTTYKTVYTCRKTLNNPQIHIVPVFLSNNTAGNTFGGINYIQAGTDTILQAASYNSDQGNRLNTFSIRVGDDTLLDDPDVRDFVNGMGLDFYGADHTINGGTDRYNMKISYAGDVLNKVLAWKPPTIESTQDGFAGGVLTGYWLGELTLANIFRFVGGSIRVNITNILRDLPKYLNVFLLNHTNKNYTGSFIGTTGILGSGQGEDKLVGTIPFVVDNPDISQIVSVNYETFNPFYRPLNNPNVYSTNEFIIEISYKDFRTDEKHQINQIDGLVKVELNFIKKPQQNFKKTLTNNSVVPII